MEGGFFLILVFAVVVGGQIVLTRRVRVGGERGGLRGLIGLRLGLDDRVGGVSDKLLLRLWRPL